MRINKNTRFCSENVATCTCSMSEHTCTDTGMCGRATAQWGRFRRWLPPGFARVHARCSSVRPSSRSRGSTAALGSKSITTRQRRQTYIYRRTDAELSLISDVINRLIAYFFNFETTTKCHFCGITKISLEPLAST